MPDGATKILLSTKGRLDDIPSDLKAFIDYVDGVLGNAEFVQEIDREIFGVDIHCHLSTFSEFKNDCFSSQMCIIKDTENDIGRP